MYFAAQIIRGMVRRDNHHAEMEPILQSYASLPWGFPKAWFPAKIVVRRQDTHKYRIDRLSNIDG